MQKTVSTAQDSERAIVAALLETDFNPLEELSALVVAAGASVVGCIVQKRTAEPATLFGKGKIEEIKQEIAAFDANLLVVDNELSGSQMRNLTEALGVKVLDRSGLILDIFAMRATSPEGKLQVDLAQLKYNLPKLVGVSGIMAKFGGGIGMRGPGEKKLETDKRIIREQITDLTKKLEKLKDERALRRNSRAKNYQKTVSLVGYTNAGKSTIMNVLSKSHLLAKDMLFATLDPITRKAHLAEGKNYLITDTVGFIKNLPHEFVNAFASTLEEAKLADLLIIVLDVSSKDIISQYEVVCDVLTKLEIDYSKALTVFNKCDLRLEDDILPASGERVFISARTGEGIETLKNTISLRLFGEPIQWLEEEE